MQEYIVKIVNNHGEIMRLTVNLERFNRLKEYCKERGLKYEVLATI